MTDTAKILLEVKDLKMHFPVNKSLFSKKQFVKAVDGVSFEIREGETLGLVGESGCGKSSLGRTVVKMYEPTSGEILFDGKDVTSLRGAELKQFRKDAQLIFQDPYASLDPRMTVGEIIKEPMVIHGLYASDAEREQRVVELLQIVGLKPDHIRRYPHEFSGVSASAFPSPALWHLNRSLSSAMNPSVHWTFPFRHRLSIFSRRSSRKRVSPICLWPTT